MSKIISDITTMHQRRRIVLTEQQVRRAVGVWASNNDDAFPKGGPFGAPAEMESGGTTHPGNYVFTWEISVEDGE